MKNNGNDTVYLPGKHILLDLWGAKNIDDCDFVEDCLKKVAKFCGATILNSKMHNFGENAGVTGVVMLAESHISIHTWPETGFAAIDVFMCGDCDAVSAVEPLKQYFQPEKFKIKEIKRG